MIPVRLDQEAIEWLNERFPAGRPPVSSIIAVLLQVSDDGQRVNVMFTERHRGDLVDHRLGELDQVSALLFRPYTDEGANSGRPVTVDAIRKIRGDGTWSPALYRPEPWREDRQ